MISVTNIRSVSPIQNISYTHFPLYTFSCNITTRSIFQPACFSAGCYIEMAHLCHQLCDKKTTTNRQTEKRQNNQIFSKNQKYNRTKLVLLKCLTKPMTCGPVRNNCESGVTSHEICKHEIF